jgi:hypothetical protein
MNIGNKMPLFPLSTVDQARQKTICDYQSAAGPSSNVIEHIIASSSSTCALFISFANHQKKGVRSYQPAMTTNLQHAMMDKRGKNESSLRIKPCRPACDGLPSNNKKTGFMSRENRIKITSRKEGKEKSW